MNAKLSLRDLMAQAEVEYGINSDESEYKRALNVAEQKSAKALEIAEELLDILNRGEKEGYIRLGFADGPTDAADAIRWEIQSNFIDEMVGEGILSSAVDEDVFDENIESWLSAQKVIFQPEQYNKLQKKITLLAKEAKVANATLLRQGEVTYDPKQRKVFFDTMGCEFDSERATEIFLSEMFKCEIGEEKDWSELYRLIGGDEFSSPNEIDKLNNYEAVKTVKDHINRRVKEKFNTPNLLFKSNQRLFRRCF